MESASQHWMLTLVVEDGMFFVHNILWKKENEQTA
jgi:hypothetical protein